MTADEKIIKLMEITAGTNIDAEQLAALLAIMGKLNRCDITKVVWAAIGTANALSCIKFHENRKEN